jgi:hypothetical protein
MRTKHKILTEQGAAGKLKFSPPLNSNAYRALGIRKEKYEISLLTPMVGRSTRSSRFVPRRSNTTCASGGGPCKTRPSPSANF